MTKTDPRIAAASAHWSHRFVANGVPLADFQDVTGAITEWDEWCDAWCARGDVHRELGEASLAQGHTLSAGEHLTRASVCYHFGKFLFVHDPDTMRKAHQLAIDCRMQALAHLDPPGERVAIPFEGHTLFGVLRRPKMQGRAPVVVMAMGLDSTKEEMDSNEAVFLARGMATLSFDGPGQGEAEYDLPIMPEYERPVSAVIDFLETRDDIDSSRVAIWGVSLGGYYAPRAAAFEPRLKACISLTGPFDFAEAFERAPALTQSAFIARSHCKTAQEAAVVAGRMNLKDAAQRITCPTYVVGGRLDRVIPPQHAELLANSVQGPAVLNMVEDGTHVVNNRPYKYRTQAADWLAGHLSAGNT